MSHHPSIVQSWWPKAHGPRACGHQAHWPMSQRPMDSGPWALVVRADRQEFWKLYCPVPTRDQEPVLGHASHTKESYQTVPRLPDSPRRWDKAQTIKQGWRCWTRPSGNEPSRRVNNRSKKRKTAKASIRSEDVARQGSFVNGGSGRAWIPGIRNDIMVRAHVNSTMPKANAPFCD